MPPHQPVKVSAVDPGLSADCRAVANSKPLDDLLRVHNAQYTYPSREIKPHMYTVPSHNGGMGEDEIRQLLARNIRDRMQRTPALDTQKKLSIKSGVAQPHISRILRRTSAATIDALGAIAGALGCQPWELLVDSHLTRRAALERMILGDAVPDEQVAKVLPIPPKPAGGQVKVAVHRKVRVRNKGVNKL